MKKHYLETTFDDEFILFGMASPERPHRLAWLINTTMGYQLSRNEDILLIGKENQENHFCRFDYLDELNRMQFHLLGNKDENQFLVPELRNIDYVMMMKGALEYFEKDAWISVARQIEQIQLVTEIDHSLLKSQHNLFIPD